MQIINDKSDETVDKLEKSDPERAERPDFERGIGPFGTLTFLCADRLIVRYFPFATF
ncbi:hypothetical protein KC799_03755 [candidate division KSB1 bacterium]|nr:hypothetical protein [candidate division KSB1 bacterium]